jgi:hypothetical protein
MPETKTRIIRTMALVNIQRRYKKRKQKLCFWGIEKEDKHSYLAGNNE